jgi:hypothetical protein
MYTCTYEYMYICKYVYMYIYIYGFVAPLQIHAYWLIDCFPTHPTEFPATEFREDLDTHIYIYQYIFIQTIINIYISTQRHANTCVDTLHWKCNTPFPSNLLSGAAVDCKIACSDGSSGQIQKEKHILDWSWIIYIYLYIYMYICIFRYQNTWRHHMPYI